VGRFDGAPVTVPIGPCECPGSPHDQDEVYLRPRLGYEAGVDAALAMQTAFAEQMDSNRLARRIVPVYIRGGAIGWNLLDADGSPLPFDPEIILSDWETALLVGDKADDIYSEAVIRPLVRPTSGSSPSTPTTSSTSAPPNPPGSAIPGNGCSQKPRRRSKPSSTSTSRTAGIVQISRSPESDSSSSQSLAPAG
jgi:hypothetical protein